MPCPGRDLLELLLACQLPPGDFAALEDHVEGCRHCQAVLEGLTCTEAVALVKPASSCLENGGIPAARADNLSSGYLGWLKEKGPPPVRNSTQVLAVMVGPKHLDVPELPVIPGY